jgi:hypothetical protein
MRYSYMNYLSPIARADVPESGYFVWPWSYNECSNISTNQKINACLENPGYGLNANQGRGSPEIDLLEAMSGYYFYPDGSSIANFSTPYLSTSYQVAPGVPDSPHRPKNGFPLQPGQTWYSGMTQGTYFNSELNFDYYGGPCGEPDFGGPQNLYMADCISLRSELNKSYWESQHVFRLEWQPGEYIDWYVDGHFVYSIPQESLLNVTGSLLALEPMFIIANVAMSQNWGFPSCEANPNCNSCHEDCFDCMNPSCDCNIPEGMKNCSNLPSEMKIDYIRLYQDSDDSLHTLGCSPVEYPTADYIVENNSSFIGWTPIPEPPIWDYIWFIFIGDCQLFLFWIVLFLCCFVITRIGFHLMCSNDHFWCFKTGPKCTYSEISGNDFSEVHHNSRQL